MTPNVQYLHLKKNSAPVIIQMVVMKKYSRIRTKSGSKIFFGQVRAKILCIPQNLPAPTPMSWMIASAVFVAATELQHRTNFHSSSIFKISWEHAQHVYTHVLSMSEKYTPGSS